MQQIADWLKGLGMSEYAQRSAENGGGLTELVDREEEFGLLLRCWAKAKRGGGQVVLVSGEPGIGKLRLRTSRLQERQMGQGHRSDQRLVRNLLSKRGFNWFAGI
jgi:DNA helicase TIP49 (TBP-interacting protein)